MSKERVPAPILSFGLLLVLVLAISLLLRLTALDVFLTVDEPRWGDRSLSFYNALGQRDLEATYQSEHPGVVTMWIGAAAIHISNAIEGLDVHTELGRKLYDALVSPRQARFPEVTFWARRIVALVTWLGTLILYFALRRAFGRQVALIATAAIALDPFYLAHSRLHHLDALLTTFTMLSAVSLLAYEGDGKRFRYLVLSAVSGGLAMLAKSPGVVLIPWTLVVLLIRAWRAETGSRKTRLLQAARAMLYWFVIATGVIAATWPALWVAPLGTLEKIISGTLRQSLNPHENLNFFWFKVRLDPGPAFYPVAWAFRTTPWVMGGLVALAVAARKRVRKERILEMVLFILGYGALVTISRKKFDRYLLPIFPLIDILGAVGCAEVLAGARTSLRWKRVAPASVAAIILALTNLALIWPARPHYLSYYNPVVGGTRTAPQILLVGWGEGLEKAAAYLNEKPNAQDLRTTLQTSFYTLDPFFVGHTTPPGTTPLVETDYFVLYASSVQRGFLPEVLDHYYGVEPPEYVASLNGLEYAWVYPNTLYRRTVQEILDHIEGQGRSAGDVVILSADAAFSKNYQGPLCLSVVAGHPRDDFILNGLERASAGRDRVWLMTFPKAAEDVGELIRRHLERQARQTEVVTISGVAATSYELHDQACFASCDPAVHREFRLGDRIRLLGYDPGPTALTPGETFSIRFYWQTSGPTEVSYKVFTHLQGPDGEVYGQCDSEPQGWARPTTTWLAGETVLDDYKIEVAQDAPPGEYVLEVGMYRLDTMERLPIFDQTGCRLAEDRILISGLRLPRPGS